MEMDKFKRVPITAEVMVATKEDLELRVEKGKVSVGSLIDVMAKTVAPRTPELAAHMILENIMMYTAALDSDQVAKVYTYILSAIKDSYVDGEYSSKELENAIDEMFMVTLKQIADTFVREMEEERAYRKACEASSKSEKDDL